MSGDWLKIEANTPDKPEVLAMSDSLGIHPTQTFGCLFMVWRWFDQHTVEGNAASVTKLTVDRLAGISGFSDAMVNVGWLVISADGSIALPNFDRHCGKTAKQRALGAKRVAAHKEKTNANGNAASVSDALPREEKRREENKPSSATDVAGYSNAFLAFWDMYPNRKNKGAAFKAFKKIKPAEYPAVKEGLNAKKSSDDWLRDNGQYIPHPATWINARGWEDETSSSPTMLVCPNGYPFSDWMKLNNQEKAEVMANHGK